jgi:SAM-dependent methyltransferase
MLRMKQRIKKLIIELSDLVPTRCAICHTPGNATELYPANFDLSSLNPQIFSARRLPDRLHYRLVKCNKCGLVRSDPIAPPDVLARLYKQSTFTYTSEVENIKQTYGRYLAGLTKYGVQKNALLEIGCGNGFFLGEALAQGYLVARGIEPSEGAVLEARPDVRPHIVCDMMRPGIFKPEQFDVICLFQVLDHLFDPGSLLDECFNILKPGGLILCVNHNIESWTAKLLKQLSPIIDIEHTFLYSSGALNHIFESHGFISRQVAPVYNIYTASYLTHLLPLPVSIKTLLLNFLTSSPLGKIPLSVPLGNIYIVAQKPDRQA